MNALKKCWNSFLLDVLTKFELGQKTKEQAIDALMEWMEEEMNSEDVREDVIYEQVQQRKKERIHSALLLGKPDLFGTEMRDYWDNGTWGNV